MLRVAARGVVYDAAKAPIQRKVAFFDGLLRLASGAWLCGFYVGTGKHSPDGTLAFRRSRDDAASWQPLPHVFETTIDGIPGSLAGAEVVETESGRLLLTATWFDRSDPAKPLFDPVTEGILRSRQLLSESTDEGDSWSPWRVVATPGLTGTATTGPSIRWANGTIALAFESFKEFDDPRPARHGAWLLPSRDGGRTFDAPWLVARDPADKVYYWDQRLCTAGPNGEFLALFWTHDRALKRDLNVHILKGTLGQSPESLGQPTDTGIPGQIAAPLILDDGRVLAFVVNRDRPGTMTLWQSRDGGRSWPEGERLIVHSQDERAALSQGKDNIDFAQYWEDMGKWSFGHPAIRHAGEGNVLVTWYAGDPGCLSVHWARIAVD